MYIILAAHLAYKLYTNYIIQIINSLFDIMCFYEILIKKTHCNWDVIKV